MNDMMRMMLTAYLESGVRRPPGPARRRWSPTTRSARSVSCATTACGPARSSATTSSSSPNRSARSPPNAVSSPQDGVEHPVDVIVYGTGFQASKFLMPMKVDRPRRRRPARTVGRRRTRLPRHHGAGLPEPVLPLRTEHEHRHQRQHRLLLRVRGALRARLHRAPAARPTIARSTSARTCTTRSTSASTPRTGTWRGVISSVNSWYKSESGRVAQNWPFTLLEYWQRTLRPDPADYELIASSCATRCRTQLRLSGFTISSSQPWRS